MNKRIITAVLAGIMSLAMAVSASADGSSSITIGGVLNIPYSSDYVLTIPATSTGLNLNSAEAQSLGTLSVAATESTRFNSYNEVVITITSTNNGNLKNTGNSDMIPYTLGIGASSVSNWTNVPTITFSSAIINSSAAEKNVAMTVTINTANVNKNIANGSYQDVLTFTAATKTYINVAASDDGASPASTFDVTGYSTWEDFMTDHNDLITTAGHGDITSKSSGYYLAFLNGSEWSEVNMSNSIDATLSYKWSLDF